MGQTANSLDMTTAHNTFFSSVIATGIAGGVMLFLPLSAFAAQVYFKVVSNTVIGDEAAIVEAYIDPQTTDLNVIEGIVSLQNTKADISSVVVETGGSVLTLWPVMPAYDKHEQIIRFTGGAPEGFNQEGLLFRMRIFASQPEVSMVSWVGGAAYKHDGAGTKIPISARSLTVSLAQGKPNQISPASVDSTPPHFGVIEVGREPSVYDGQYFISFYATDDISGVRHYQVSEGQETTDVSDGVYVLHDQERKTRVFITVYDQAGNSRTVEVSLTYHWKTGGILLLLIAMLAFALWYVHKKFINA
jgi:hypothetical protein